MLDERSMTIATEFSPSLSCSVRRPGLLQQPERKGKKGKLEQDDCGQPGGRRTMPSTQQEADNGRGADNGQRNRQPGRPWAGESEFAARVEIARILEQEFEQKGSSS